ncbi:FAD-dependent oxidoreductase [Candidatus Rhodobacter oscarellae]|nr:FAD-dependent oxidoreductase [Candidatus Rhodobacter lobularis]
MPYDYKPFPYTAPPGLTAPEPRHKVVIVGAGPIGLALALELAQHGMRSVVLDDNDVVSIGSRAICWSKRSLEILDRLGIGETCAEKGVTWKIGRTYHGDRELFNFDLLPEEGHKMPAFVNLQQYYVEQFLAEAALASDLIELRFKNKVSNIAQNGECVTVSVDTPDGSYQVEAEYLVACDGARSPIRNMMGLDFDGELFEERFLIADIEMQAETPPERWFWFEPTFHPGQSALMHKQPDNIYRIDLQLGWDADPEAEKQPEVVIPRIEKVVGHGDFRLDWVSVYSFQCRRLERFVHNRVVFAGDSAHVVSPFGARGGNGGMQDVDALGWRLAGLMRGDAGLAILEDYNTERVHGADENIFHSAGATKFMSPADGPEREERDRILAQAATDPEARSRINSGRLSVPCVYPLQGAPDGANLPDATRPGSVALDAPQGDGWLLNRLGGGMKLLCIGCSVETDVDTVSADLNDFVARRYLGEAKQAVYLIRPDQVIAARWIDPKPAEIDAALASIWR